ncbi:MAG: hypothetical protein GY857_10280 [Desulfobacula sp.]|nr:hypothetical protein [Desulfobacula sp.]
MLFYKKHRILFYTLLFFSAINLSTAMAGSQFGSKPWTKLSTGHTIIKYKSDDVLKKFHRSIKYGRSAWNRSGTFSSMSQSELEGMLQSKIDAIFKRAETILDMRRPMDKISINIYPDSGELKRAYSIIYRSKCRVRAWYRFRTNTVYINAEDVHAGMLAHELAHGIIDHFFRIKPPSETAEILARYVDNHL